MHLHVAFKPDVHTTYFSFGYVEMFLLPPPTRCLMNQHFLSGAKRRCTSATQMPRGPTSSQEATSPISHEAVKSTSCYRYPPPPPPPPPFLAIATLWWLIHKGDTPIPFSLTGPRGEVYCLNFVRAHTPKQCKCHKREQRHF